jgi:FkbM family methyltransferase
MKFFLRIAYSVAKRANNYYTKLTLKEKKAKDESWIKLFSLKNSFVGNLNETLLINFYKDSILSKLIYTNFEQNEIVFLRKYLKPGDTFFDIGSNIGLFSLHAAQIVTNKGSIHAFEPTPNTFARLMENIELNRYQHIITANNIGISSNIGTLSLNISTDGHDAWNTFAKQSEICFEKKIEIPVEKLDNYLTEKNISCKDIALIKIDVEGWEMEVIKGAKNLLIEENAPVLMVEFTESNLFAAGTNCYEIYDLVVSYGYMWYTYDSKNNILHHDSKRIHYPYNNLIAIKNFDQAQERIR